MNLPPSRRFFAAILGFTAGLLALTPASAVDAVLHSFTGGSGDGSYPYGSLTLSGTKLYGMTSAGGNGNLGTLFSMNTDGTGFAVVNSIGGAPRGSLTLSGSALYGMTYSGGASNSGTIFRFDTSGTPEGDLHSLHTFTGNVGDGGRPYGSLTVSAGKLYGMTRYGGSNNFGALFSLNADGTGFALLHSFTGIGGTGYAPNGSLTLDGTKVYGMTPSGGSADGGTLFSMNPDGSGFVTLHNFGVALSGDGRNPYGSLTLLGSKLYGTTSQGGTLNFGTLFSLNTDGTGYTLLHNFTATASDGQLPYGALTPLAGKLYGMSDGAGSANRGTLFSINANGTGFATVHSFAGLPGDGAYPQYGEPIFSADGATLYGMTEQGGTANMGVVFSIAIAPEPTSALLLLTGAGLLLRRRRGR